MPLTAPKPTPSGRATTGTGSGAAQPSVQRHPLVAALTWGALYGGIVQGVAIDRPRVAFAFSHAHAQGGKATAKWASELVTGWVTNDIVPIEGGTVRLGSRLRITDAWHRAYQASRGLAVAGLAVKLIYGIPNLVEALHEGGPEALVNTREGRTGAISVPGTLFDAGVLAIALIASKGKPNPIRAAFTSPIFASNRVVLTAAALTAPVLLNEWGFLDFLNKGSRSDAVTNAHDTAIHLLHLVPGLDDRLPPDPKPNVK
ncbi:MAG: hypothetical protein JWN41_1374 [Thermoleophilia bacterium]|nr:hypothetical protein [Thermoleophilia bacterium]